ncbi:MAG: hypothetical protein GX558_04290 [Clostridiales bacterium]|nr:hypothetical protein [Clostridiales bacterium]
MNGRTTIGLLAGVALGAAAAAAYSMMSGQDKARLRKFAQDSGHKLAEKTGEIMGK